MTGAFLFSGGFWLIIAAAALWIGVCLLTVRRAPDEYDLWENGADGVPRSDEELAYARIYDLRNSDKRVENVAPQQTRGTQKW